MITLTFTKAEVVIIKPNRCAKGRHEDQKMVILERTIQNFFLFNLFEQTAV